MKVGDEAVDDTKRVSWDHHHIFTAPPWFDVCSFRDTTRGTFQGSNDCGSDRDNWSLVVARAVDHVRSFVAYFCGFCEYFMFSNVIDSHWHEGPWTYM